MLHTIDPANSGKFEKAFTKTGKIFSGIFRVAQLTQFDYKSDFVTGKLILTFRKNEGISFQGEEIPRILGFQAKPDPTQEGFYHIGYK